MTLATSQFPREGTPDEMFARRQAVREATDLAEGEVVRNGRIVLGLMLEDHDDYCPMDSPPGQPVGEPGSLSPRPRQLGSLLELDEEEQKEEDTVQPGAAAAAE